MIIDTELDIIQYVGCVDKIASRFFNEELEYEPYIGMLHAMCIFYNLCVKESGFKESVGDEVHDIWEIRDVAKDPEFIKEFNNAIQEQDSFGLNFNNAYKQAMNIVEHKKNPANNILDFIKILGTEISGSIGEFINIGSLIGGEIGTGENAEIPQDASTIND